ncbi:MAG: BACON domain-containing carbohydrate-binding protein [Bacteroidales bacterium]|nr:BACON domain-containing carbohydrate-binding protein [Bacteroidales bacterium]
MKTNRFLGFIMSVAALAFAATACDDKKEDLGAPSVEVEKSEISFEKTGGTETVQVTATRDWKATTEQDWISIGPKEGEASSKAVTVEIKVMENTGVDREGSVKFDIGFGSKTLTVKQKGTGSVADMTVYKNNFDKAEATKTYGTGTSWPYLDQFDGWKNATGTGAGSEEYSFKAMSARANSTSNSNYSDYAGSGSNNLFFGSNAYFSVTGIKLQSATDYSLTFGAEKYSQDNGSLFKHNEFHVYVSNDGAKWVELEYSFPNGDKEGRWDLATSNFTVPSGTTTLGIYVKVDVASSYRLDDLCLAVASSAGTVIDFSKGVDLGTGGGDNPGPATEMKISEVLSSPSGTAAIVTGTVAATYQRGFVITDGADYLLVYDGTKCAAKEKDNVKVSGTTSEYGGLIQLASPEVTVVSSGNALTLPSPKVLDAAAFDAYSSSKIEYISYEGTLSVSGNYVNVEVAGATKHTGSLAYINDSFNAKSFDGAVVKVTGFYVGLASNNKYVNTMVTDLVPGASDYLTVSTTTLSAAADATTATFDVKANVAWTITSDNSAYTVEPASGDKNATVTVKFAANTAETDKVVKLTVSTTADVATKSYTVTLTHRGKSGSQGGSEIVASVDKDYLAKNKSGKLDDVISYENDTDYDAGTTVTELRVYKGKNLTIKAVDGYTITKVEFTCTKNCGVKQGFYTTSPVIVDAGATSTSAGSGNVGTITVSGNTATVKYTASENQMRVTKLAVTYKAK